MNQYYDLQIKLLEWFNTNKRDLPWRRIKDPYTIYLSEIILQQTRVNQGLEYYARFVKYFPAVNQLAAASEAMVLKLWQGLGYYSRARNMLKAAKVVMKDFDGKFPSDYSSLLKLPGVGPYTAAAVSSMATNQPVAVVDGNVERVLSRLFLYADPVNSTQGKKDLHQLEQSFLYVEKAGDYNQAMMELGALVCIPQNAVCEICPFKDACLALKQRLVNTLPVKLKKKKQRDRYFYYFWVEYQNKIWARQRKSGDVWQGLYEPVLIETDKHVDENELVKHFNKKIEAHSIESFADLKAWKTRHVLTHQVIHAAFYKVSLKDFNSIEGYRKISINEFEKLPVSRLVEAFYNKCINPDNP